MEQGIRIITEKSLADGFPVQRLLLAVTGFFAKFRRKFRVGNEPWRIDAVRLR
jgi:hypothetical protein